MSHISIPITNTCEFLSFTQLLQKLHSNERVREKNF